MNFGKSSWRTYEQGIQREWLLTNGIGGFASSTIIGSTPEGTMVCWWRH